MASQQQVAELVQRFEAMAATNAAITAELNQLRRENQQISQESALIREQANIANQRVAETIPEMLNQLKEAVTSSGSRTDRVQLVDPRGIGKPTVFHSDESKFRPWAKKTESFITGVFRNLSQCLNGP